MSSTFKQLQKNWQKCWDALCEATDKDVEARVRELVGRVKTIQIDKICMSAEGWTFSGPEITVSWDEQPAETFPSAVCDLCGWLECQAEGRQWGWTPVGVKTVERKALMELYALLNWWLEKTGGHDVVFRETE